MSFLIAIKGIPGKSLQHSSQETTTLLSSLLQHSYQERPQHYRTHISKMIEYLKFILLCTLLGAASSYPYYEMKTLLKMVKESFTTDLLPEDPRKSDVKRQKLIECVLTGNSKQYLGKAYTEEQINELSEEEVDELFSNYEVKHLEQMAKSLGKSIIKKYSMGACEILGMTNQDALSKDLKSDPFLNSA